MEPVYIALIILTIIYVPFWFIVKFGDKIGPLKNISEKLRSKGLTTYLFILIMIRTKWGIKLIDRLGKYKRFWRVCGVLSRIVTIILMAYIVAILVIDVLYLGQAMSQSGIGIQYALAIPGLNPMLPIVYGWIALVLAMVVHELAHGFQTRANDMDVKSTGVLYGVVPWGAFVEPDEEQVEKASRRAKIDLYAAGITTNFIVAMIAFLLMVGCINVSVSSDYWDNPAVYGVTSNSPAYDAGIPTTSIITDINGYEIHTLDQFYDHVIPADLNTITYRYHDDVRTASLVIGTFVETVSSSSPAERGGLQKGDIIRSITVNGGETKTFATNTEFSNYMKTTHPGDDAVVNVYRNGTYTDHSVTLANNNGVGYLGVSTTTSGFQFVTPNITLSYGTDPFYGCSNIVEYSYGAIQFIGKAWNGYSPVPESTHWWYETSIDSNVFWVIVQLLYWIFWLNIVLGVSNALPSVPFDGGFLYMGGLDYIFEKFGMKNKEKREQTVKKIGSLTSCLVIGILLIVMYAIIF